MIQSALLCPGLMSSKVKSKLLNPTTFDHGKSSAPIETIQALMNLCDESRIQQIYFLSSPGECVLFCILATVDDRACFKARKLKFKLMRYRLEMICSACLLCAGSYSWLQSGRMTRPIQSLAGSPRTVEALTMFRMSLYLYFL